MKNKTYAEQFCQKLLGTGLKHSKAIVNIILSLGSETTARSPTALSLSPYFQYPYSMQGKAMKDNGEQFNSGDSLALKSELRQVFFEQLPAQSVYKTATDFTTIRKPSSPTLEGRGFVHVPNVIIYGNKPIDIRSGSYKVLGC